MTEHEQAVQRAAEAMGLWLDGMPLMIAMALGVAAAVALAAVTATVTNKAFPYSRDPRARGHDEVGSVPSLD